MEQSPTALILAGGFATRLWPLTEKRAKPLLPLAGKPLIQHIIDDIPKEVPIVISTNMRFEEDFLELKKLYPQREITVYLEDSHSDRQKKGALAATAQVIQDFEIKSPLLLIAGDNYFGFSTQEFLQQYSGKTLLASFDTKSLQTARQFGVLEVDGKKLTSFIEKPTDPPSTLISTGCYLFSPEHLEDIQEYSQIAADNLGGVFEHLLQKSAEVEVFPFEDDWIDIGSFESYLTAHRQLLEGQRIHESSTLTDTQLGEAVEVGQNCKIEGSILDHVIVMEGCTIKNSRLRGCIVDKHCVIENVDLDHKMIREGSNISGI